MQNIKQNKIMFKVSLSRFPYHQTRIKDVFTILELLRPADFTDYNQKVVSCFIIKKTVNKMSNIERKVVQRITIIERQVIQEIPAVQKNETNLLELETATHQDQGYMPFQEQRDYNVSGANTMEERRESMEISPEPLVQKEIPVYDYIENRERTRSPETQRKMRNLAYQDLLPERLQDNYRSVHPSAPMANTYETNNNVIYNEPSFNQYKSDKVTGTQEYHMKQTPQETIIKQKLDFVDPVTGIQQKSKIQTVHQRPIASKIINRNNTFSSTSSDQGVQRHQRYDRVQRFQEPMRYQQPIVAANIPENNYAYEAPVQARDEQFRKQKVTGTKKFYMKETPTQKIVKNKTDFVDPLTGKAEKYQVKTETKLNQRRRSLSRNSSSSNQIVQQSNQTFGRVQEPYVSATSGVSGYDYVSSTPAESYLQSEKSDILRNKQDIKGTEQYYMKSTPNQLITEKKVDIYDPVTGQAEKIEIKTKAKRDSSSSRSSSDSQKRRRKDRQEGKLDRLERNLQEKKQKVLGQVPVHNKRVTHNYVDTDAYVREKGMIKTTANSVKTKEKLDYVDPVTGNEQKATIKTKVRGANFNHEEGKTSYDYKIQDTAQGQKKVMKEKRRVGGVIKNIKNKIENILHR